MAVKKTLFLFFVIVSPVAVMAMQPVNSGGKYYWNFHLFVTNWKCVILEIYKSKIVLLCQRFNWYGKKVEKNYFFAKHFKFFSKK